MKSTELLLIAVFLLTCAGCQRNMVELKTELPPAKFDRTQVPRRKQGEAFLVPQGTKLLSRGVEVTSSDMEPIIGELNMVTDGNKEIPDGFYYVELGYGLQWVQLDLGKPQALYAILVWHYYLPGPFEHDLGWEYTRKWPRVYRDVVVQISNDPSFKMEVKTVFNNDHDNSSGLGKGEDDTYVETSEGRWIDSKGVEGRYVRLYSNGFSCHNSMYNITSQCEFNNYIEVEVYGK